MGCGSSVEGDRSQRKYDSDDTTAEDWARSVGAPDLALHAPCDFERGATESEAAQFRKLDDEWSLHSRGDLGEEPAPFVRAFREKRRVLEARLRHDINDDPCQFKPLPEPRGDVEASCRRCRRWLEFNERLCAAERRRGSTTESTISASFSIDDLQASPLGGTGDAADPYCLAAPLPGTVWCDTSATTDAPLTPGGSSLVPLSSPGTGRVALAGFASDFGSPRSGALDDRCVSGTQQRIPIVQTPHASALPGPALSSSSLLSPSPLPGACIPPRRSLTAESLHEHATLLRHGSRALQPSAGGSPGKLGLRSGHTPPLRSTPAAA